MLTLRGTEDASNDLAACAQREDELRAIGTHVEAHVFETSRMDRILIRVSSGDQMEGCVKNGYVIGRDDATKAKTGALLLAFLEREFGMP